LSLALRASFAFGVITFASFSGLLPSASFASLSLSSH
jgi:hypothetical protein